MPILAEVYLPPDPRLWPFHLRRRFPGCFWPHEIDPEEVPWSASHRLHFRLKTGEARSVDVRFLINCEVSCDSWGRPVRQTWYGYAAHQWRRDGMTPWALAQRYIPGPHTLLRTDGLHTIDHRSLAFERLLAMEGMVGRT